MIPSLLQIPSAVSDSKLHSVLPNNGKGDFTFDRSTGATRINKDGLIEEVGYFSSELVQNGNFSELGSEIIINGDFATDSDWTLPTGCTINNGKLRIDNVSLLNVTQAYVYTSGKTYKITYTISDYVKGKVRLQLGGGGGTTNGVGRSANGTYTEYLTANANHTSARVRPLSDDGGFTGSVDNVSVKQVDPNDRWTLGGDAWSITDKLSADGTQTTGTNSYQSQTFDNGKTYKIVFTCTIQAGNLDVRLQGGGSTVVGTTHTTSGTYTQLLTSTGNTSLRFRGNEDFIGSISSVSAVEVQGDRPRLSYDITNGVVDSQPHLLLEPQRTNRLSTSNVFTNWVISGNITITANQIISPDGTKNASIIDFSSATSSSNGVYVFGGSPSSAPSRSIYLKGAIGGETLNFSDPNQGGGSSITLTNKWQRFDYTGGSAALCGIWLKNSVGNVIHAFGAQIEEGTYPTSYIPTAGTTITRAAETCNNSKPSVNSTEGVLYADINIPENIDSNVNISLSAGVHEQNLLKIIYLPSVPQLRGELNVSSSVQTILADNNFVLGTYNKIGLVFNSSTFEMYINGIKIGSASTNGLPSGLNQFNLDRADGTAPFYGKVKGLAVYNEALTDAQLIELTS